MNIFEHFEGEIAAAITEILPPNFDPSKVRCELPRDSSHGDLSTNAAMVLAKTASMKPRDLAAQIAEKLTLIKGIDSIEIAGAGFVNMKIAPKFWRDRIDDILASGDDWGKSDTGAGKTINVEYVSANPTGPLHAAHARGAIIGDSLAALLEATGHTVIREYYINDAGSQVDILGKSAYLRYREAAGQTIDAIPEGYYPGSYLKKTGQKFFDRHGDSYLTKDEAEWLPVIRDFAIDDMMASVKEDLLKLGIKMDVFSSERQIVEAGLVDTAIAKLSAKGLIYEGILEAPKGGKPTDDYEAKEQMLFRSTDFGDDVDRPIKKSDGSWTYFASDIAYHLDKLSRNANKLIDIWGADHGGYIKRMSAAVTALSGDKDAFDVRLCQLVNLMDGGKPVKMSKRAGTFVTLADVLDSVGKDILRFMMLTRRNDQPMDFDYAKVTEQSRDNPVFYVQYAHARARSVLRQAGIDPIPKADLSPLTDAAELDLMKVMASYPRLIQAASDAHEPHRIAFYLNDLAAAFHSLWNKGRDHSELRFITGDADATAARLRLVAALALVIRNGLAILGVEAVEEM